MLREEWESSKKSDESVLSHILKLREKLENMSELVSENVRGARSVKSYSMISMLEKEVLVLLPTTSNKLLAQWQGPYRVLQKVGEVDYKVHMPDKRKRKTKFHVNMLKRWRQPEAICMWAVKVDQEEEENVPSWRGEKGKPPSVGTQLTE